ncbi:TetR/AcrR family transcriptional regulator [Kitasatospora sp. NPDC052896]|uniref:TetR/AcrR family transcriptional regulator n=1 Tax=Kitasatospora sp. NPDC052896 TaxID=3364061 RepID=UPI0037C76F0D
MTTGRTSFPSGRATAERNRDQILAVARAAFVAGDTDISIAEVARRAGLGMAALYRNFPGRQELLEALYADEADGLCKAAITEDRQTPYKPELSLEYQAAVRKSDSALATSSGASTSG